MSFGTQDAKHLRLVGGRRFEAARWAETRLRSGLSAGIRIRRRKLLSAAGVTAPLRRRAVRTGGHLLLRRRSACHLRKDEHRTAHRALARRAHLAFVAFEQMPLRAIKLKR